MIRRQRAKRKLNAEINVVPYIDVTLVLLIIFMVTAPMLTQGVDVELPKASSEPVETQDEEPLIVTVDAEGLYYINLGEDETVPKSAEQIAGQIRQILSVNPGKMMLVRGDRQASYDQVVQLMVLLQGAGAERVGLVTE
ncbi:MAG: Biopolymer transport protein ExbD [Marinobacterium sp. xm-d-530]|jgi:biopolymer transport protein TolR|uniref:protein TolR n=1 Tax=unclassified Marinobacterium TaxID=2644139 RepID=UPI001567E518|nr:MULTISPECIES: protein TolR [unclassified Marinobacterium]CAI8216417.1 MAG: Biopolymer transport protein ExbD [Marinobacterium sp. xm-d-530]NRP47996.1 Biopolymer transport protein ExbD [Marinobacterium sp. xm-d-543]NRP52204.1 Biopolymer transport protein ExbD [Marinobacterium sp. xm-v-242]NRP76785.1 Biopolymer transport protein ExbD [Marinobacterium sp. xm-m-383]NRQ24235.1 Biopolymer transport protein ExbD [Marinobacterium sp. xm-m-312]